ncbi:MULTISPECIES: M20 family metallo-hydrolase [Pseudomonas syringae group]|uniref:M20 family metallo-hydrolase n=1 Tax=Pseudomonas syringae group TaxID=136849 RepID=UPI000EFE7F06|nr:MULTISPECIES: M20 family metallo-hydrolase [Pseudomonas syringae group]MCF5715140.1 hydantoinase/carbamoylase family amidase [Pseudomonas tremae]MCF5743044.1 hydantoinase/carbamoylase family amidase [Pseudomonas tremae]RMP22722.1 Peptidase, M20/M25/M40 family [Pseudomonas coronafaciens pv. atropurpurea]UQB29538.1 M20 family metallo-hydrolase [Pseudomonas tremae]UQB38897.1 M20 family metallo-hydrolase [Pseudomonas tremae]
MSIPSMPELIEPGAADLAAFEALFRQSSAIGATPAGGLHRLAASAEDGQARDLFRDWLEGHGFEVRVDAIGNMFGLMTFNPDAPYLLCGSHLDSQPSAGRFDGVYGVLAGAVAVATLARQMRERGEIPACNLAVVNWTNEEGARFQPSLIGSGVFTGALALNDAWESRDGDGIRLKDALQAIGYLGNDTFDLTISGYVEVHVEQGCGLENSQTAIGVVRETWAALKRRVRFDGEQNHTGPTPMAARRDALLAAAHTITAVREEAGLHGLHMHTSVGRIEVYPNSPNVVPSRVSLLIEYRSRDVELLSMAAERLDASLHAIAEKTMTGFEVESSVLRVPARLNDGLAALAHSVGVELGLSTTDSMTVAGHDAISLNRSFPVCLLFIPSSNGVSHNEAEYTSDQDMRNGLRMLTGLLHRACTLPVSSC